MILGAAPIEGRLSGVVDIPNSCSTVYIHRDLRFQRAPSKKGHTRSNPVGRPEGRRLTQPLIE